MRPRTRGTARAVSCRGCSLVGKLVPRRERHRVVPVLRRDLVDLRDVLRRQAVRRARRRAARAVQRGDLDAELGLRDLPGTLHVDRREALRSLRGLLIVMKERLDRAVRAVQRARVARRALLAVPDRDDRHNPAPLVIRRARLDEAVGSELRDKQVVALSREMRQQDVHDKLGRICLDDRIELRVRPLGRVRDLLEPVDRLFDPLVIFVVVFLSFDLRRLYGLPEEGVPHNSAKSQFRDV